MPARPGLAAAVTPCRYACTGPRPFARAPPANRRHSAVATAQVSPRPPDDARSGSPRDKRRSRSGGGNSRSAQHVARSRRTTNESATRPNPYIRRIGTTSAVREGCARRNSSTVTSPPGSGRTRRCPTPSAARRALRHSAARVADCSGRPEGAARSAGDLDRVGLGSLTTRSIYTTGQPGFHREGCYSPRAGPRTSVMARAPHG